MKIAGLQRVSLIDYPGHIAATVFLAGCNLNCGYCYNRWMIDEESAPEALSGEEFLGWLRTRVGRLDGVCVSGGEPTVHEDLAPFLRTIKGLGFAVKLDTNGTSPAHLSALLAEGLLDYVAMDLKAPLDARYNRVAGRPVDLSAIRQSMTLLRAWGGPPIRVQSGAIGGRSPIRALGDRPYEFRTTVGPLLDEGDLQDIAHEIQEAELWWLQPFVVTPEVILPPASAQALDESALRQAVRVLAGIAPGVRLRGEGGQP